MMAAHADRHDAPGGRDVLVGTCGFRGRRSEAFSGLDCIEIQKTFYQPPRPETAARWRADAPPGFVFALKAWQLITHRPGSPTYKRLREPLSASERSAAGGFQWSAVTRRAWDRTREIAEAIDAEFVVFQTPRSFRPTPENLERLEDFLAGIERGTLALAFEPRGEEWEDPEIAARIEGLGVVRAVDPFLAAPPAAGPQYLRLHGRPAYNYRYAYTDEDLERLAGFIDPRRPARVMFNNDRMAENARRFREKLAGSGALRC